MAEFSEDTYGVLKSLASNGAFQRLLDELTRKLYSIREQNDILDGVPLYRSQGKAQILSDLLGACGVADKAVERIARKKDLEGKGPSVKTIT